MKRIDKSFSYVVIGSIAGLLIWTSVFISNKQALLESDSNYPLFFVMSVILGGSAGMFLYALKQHRNLQLVYMLLTVLTLGFGLYLTGYPPSQCGYGVALARSLSPPDCIIGADIGTGVADMFLLCIWGAGSTILVTRANSSKPNAPKP